jgi:ABC transport system ATP-binding/permease protein
LELLEEMVGGYAGTLLLVSHDRAFLDNVVTSTLVFEGAAVVNEYVGGYGDWLRQRKTPATQPSAAPEPSKASSALPKPRRPSFNDQRELAAMPDKIQRLEAEQLQLQAEIADPALFRGNDERGALALQRLAVLAAELERAYARWDALESAPRPTAAE